MFLYRFTWINQPKTNFYENFNQFRIINFTSGYKKSKINLSIDNKKNFNNFKKFYIKNKSITNWYKILNIYKNLWENYNVE